MGIAEEKTINFISIGSYEEAVARRRNLAQGLVVVVVVWHQRTKATPPIVLTMMMIIEMSSFNCSAKQCSDDYGTHLDTERDRLGDDPLTLTPEKEILLAKKRDALQNNRFNEMFAEEDAVNANRQDRIRQLMDEDDKVWKAERRKRILGKYASVEVGRRWNRY